MKLGEIFIQQGVIDQKQLDEALHAQLIYGGHLGTCLIELGVIDEEQLGRVLADSFGLPYASVDRFQNIPPNVIKTIPGRVVEKFYAVPFEQNGKTLSVAMVDPKNLPTLDELAFASGCKIDPWVSPEVRIMQAMERYYDIVRRSRYITVCRELDRGWNNRKARKEGEAGQLEPRTAPPAGGPTSRPALPVSRAAVPAAAAAAVASVPEPSGPAPLHSVPPINWAAEKNEVPRNPDDRVSDALCAAENVDALADTILDHVSQTLERCILFTVKGTTAVMWGSRGIGVDRDRARSVSFPIISEPIFQLIMGEGFYRGPVPREPKYQKFYDTMEMGLASEILIVPVHLEDRLVALFYGDCGSGFGLQGEAEDYRRLFRKLAIALQLVILKRKIRSL